MCYIDTRKGETTKAAYPQIVISSYLVTAVHYCSSGRLLFSLEDLIAKTNKSDNEYHQLD